MKKSRNNFIKNHVTKALHLAISLSILTSTITYKNNNKITELLNKNNFSVLENSVQTPYNIHILRENENGFVETYIIDTSKNKKIKLYKNLRLGNSKYRLESIIGDNNDDESFIGKYDNFKNNLQNKLKHYYKRISNKIKRTNKK